MKDFIQEISEENSHLYLWVTNNFLPDGLQVIKEWGFEYKTIITWVKNIAGLGQYYRGLTEHCLFSKRGSLPYKIENGKRQQGTTCIYEPKTKHSLKPQKMYELIETVSYPDYIEIFARSQRPGWDVWGNEEINKKTIFDLK